MTTRLILLIFASLSFTACGPSQKELTEREQAYQQRKAKDEADKKNCKIVFTNDVERCIDMSDTGTTHIRFELEGSELLLFMPLKWRDPVEHYSWASSNVTPIEGTDDVIFSFVRKPSKYSNVDDVPPGFRNPLIPSVSTGFRFDVKAQTLRFQYKGTEHMAVCREDVVMIPRYPLGNDLQKPVNMLVCDNVAPIN